MDNFLLNLCSKSNKKLIFVSLKKILKISVSEIVKKDKRKVLVAGLDSMLSIGTFFVICMAYILPNWRELQLGISCFLIPVLSLVW